MSTQPETSDRELEQEARRCFDTVNGPFRKKCLARVFSEQPRYALKGWRTLAREILELKRQAKGK